MTSDVAKPAPEPKGDCLYVFTSSAYGWRGTVGAECPMREALDEAFRDWYADNYSALSLGGSGDTVRLLAMLMAAKS
jgi:hypothetical protein